MCTSAMQRKLFRNIVLGDKAPPPPVAPGPSIRAGMYTAQHTLHIKRLQLARKLSGFRCN